MTTNYVAYASWNPDSALNVQNAKDIIQKAKLYPDFSIDVVDNNVAINYFDGFKYVHRPIFISDETIEILWDAIWWRGQKDALSLIVYAYKYKLKFWDRFKNSMLAPLVYAEVLGGKTDL